MSRFLHEETCSAGLWTRFVHLLLHLCSVPLVTSQHFPYRRQTNLSTASFPFGVQIWGLTLCMFFWKWHIVLNSAVIILTAEDQFPGLLLHRTVTVGTWKLTMGTPPKIRLCLAESAVSPLSQPVATIYGLENMPQCSVPLRASPLIEGTFHLGPFWTLMGDPWSRYMPQSSTITCNRIQTDRDSKSTFSTEKDLYLHIFLHNQVDSRGLVPKNTWGWQDLVFGSYRIEWLSQQGGTKTKKSTRGRHFSQGQLST